MTAEYSGSGIIREEIERPGSTLYVRRLAGLAAGVDVMKFILARGQTDLGESSLSTEKPDWYGTRSMEEAVQQAEFGWPKGREKMNAVLEQININELLRRYHRPEPRFDVAGDEPDVSRFLLGEPCDMVSCPLGLTAKDKIANLWINATVSVGVSSEQIIRRGAVIAAAHAAVTAAGYSLGVEMVSTTEFDRTYDIIEYHIPIVRPGDYFSQDILAWCMISPSFFRRLVFALKEIEPDKRRKEIGAYRNGSYGHPRKIQSELPYQTLLIDQGEGLDLHDDNDTVRFAQGIVDQALRVLENRDDSD
ncbi:hypothetical protein FWH58_03785 [Candidatus Saccharibacteria bacterium]|nr:hypothetical protein [Candidatus Saccharibacteria bacterium]